MFVFNLYRTMKKWILYHHLRFCDSHASVVALLWGVSYAIVVAILW